MAPSTETKTSGGGRDVGDKVRVSVFDKLNLKYLWNIQLKIPIGSWTTIWVRDTDLRVTRYNYFIVETKEMDEVTQGENVE